MTTGAGFMNAELFTLICRPCSSSMRWRRCRLLAGEEERGTLDVLLVTPVSGASIVLQKALALVASLFVLGAVLFVVTLGSSALFDLGIGVRPRQVAACPWCCSVPSTARSRWPSVRSPAAGRGRSGWRRRGGAAYVLYAVGMLVEAVSRGSRCHRPPGAQRRSARRGAGVRVPLARGRLGGRRPGGHARAGPADIAAHA